LTPPDPPPDPLPVTGRAVVLTAAASSLCVRCAEAFHNKRPDSLTEPALGSSRSV
ncbi:hypothetical protein chiPu_0033893, partial [Chiloscyllium punctatum]|nr:hypothetical protein [Chiloscyllium punctatum]